MKTQVFTLSFLSFLLSGVIFTAYANGECKITRMYQDEKKYMQHMSRLVLYGEASRDKRNCETLCKRDAAYLPKTDSSQLSKKPDTQQVEISCSYASVPGAPSQVISRYNAKLNQLTLKSTSGQRAGTSSSGTGYSAPPPRYGSSSSFSSNGLKTSIPMDNGIMQRHTVKNPATIPDKAPPRYNPKTHKKGTSQSAAEFNPFQEVSPEFRANDSTYSTHQDVDKSQQQQSGNGAFNPRQLRTTPTYTPRGY